MENAENYNRQNQPEYTQYGDNGLRILLIIVLSALFLFSLYLLKYREVITVVLSLLCLIFIAIIRYPRIHLFKDHFVIEKKCIINTLSEKIIIHYKDISTIEFQDGYTNWGMIIMLVIFRVHSSGVVRNFQSDRLVITTTEKEKINVNRIGNRLEFERTIDLIKKIKTINDLKNHQQPTTKS